MAKKMSVRENLKKQLQSRMKESAQRKQQGSGSNLLNIDGASYFYPKVKTSYILDIIPYIAGENGPVKELGQLKNPAGEVAYTMEYWQHYGIGPDEKGKCVCLSSTFGRKCPVCEYRASLIAKDGDADLIKQLKPKLRSVYNIICYTGDEKKKGIQIWDVSWFFAEKMFQELAIKVSRNDDEDVDNFIYYMDPDEGKSIVFTQADKDDMKKLTGIRFEPRDYKITDEQIESAYCLENALTNAFPKDENDDIDWDKLYAIIYEALHGVASGNDESEEKPKKKNIRGEKPEEKEEVESDEDETMEDESEQEEDEKPEEKEEIEPESDEDENQESDDDTDWDELTKDQMIARLDKMPELKKKVIRTDEGKAVKGKLEKMTEEDLYFAVMDCLD